MVEASSSLTKLLITKVVLALGQNSMQSFSLTFEAGKALEPLRIFIYFLAFFVGLYGTNKWIASRSTVYSLNLFFYLPVLMTALNLVQQSLPRCLNAILVGLLTGMLFADQNFMKLHNAMKVRFWGFKLTDLSTLGMCLPMPVVETLTMLKPNQKLLSIFITVHCASFTSMLIYQLKSRSISDYAQEIDAITEEMSIEKENSVSSDPEAANKNDNLSESEQAEHKKDYWRSVGISVIIFLCYSVIPIINIIRLMRS